MENPRFLSTLLVGLCSTQVISHLFFHGFFHHVFPWIFSIQEGMEPMAKPCEGTGKMDKVNKRMAQAVAATHLARCLKASSLLEEDTLADRGDSVERLESKT